MGSQRGAKRPPYVFFFAHFASWRICRSRAQPEPTHVGDRIDNSNRWAATTTITSSAKSLPRLTDPKSGRIIEVRTTQPAVQLDTANHLRHTAVCLETQRYPDSIHHPNFPPIVVKPGTPLKETTVFAFLAK
jgi:galactose mutarotase-like enzyme